MDIMISWADKFSHRLISDAFDAAIKQDVLNINYINAIAVGIKQEEDRLWQEELGKLSTGLSSNEFLKSKVKNSSTTSDMEAKREEAKQAAIDKVNEMEMRKLFEGDKDELS
jgi:hypothetical protein